jgi:hypothetical protein
MPTLITIAINTLDPDEEQTLTIVNEVDLTELSVPNRLRLYYMMEKYAAVGRLIEEEQGEYDEAKN